MQQPKEGQEILFTFLVVKGNHVRNCDVPQNPSEQNLVQPEAARFRRM